VLYPLSYEGGPAGSLPCSGGSPALDQMQPLTLIRLPTLAHTFTFGSGGGGGTYTGGGGGGG
jgi:hypothetical protein